MRRRNALAALALCAALCSPAPARAFSIVATYDTSITNHPQAATIMNTISTAIAAYPAKITDPVAVNITFARMLTGLGASSKTIYQVNYTNYINALRARTASYDDATALMVLPGPGSNPVNGDPKVWVAQALGRTLGIVTVSEPAGLDDPVVEAISVMNPSLDDPRAVPADPEEIVRVTRAARRAQPSAVQVTSDGTISLNLDLMNLTTNPTSGGLYSLRAVTQHEIDEVLGSSSVLNGVANGAAVPSGPVHVQDLFRYDKFGNRSLTTSATDSAYFSIDGVTRLARYNQVASGDYSDLWSNVSVTRPYHVQDAFATPDTDPVMDVEWTILDVLGWSYGPVGTWVDFTYTGGGSNGGFLTPWPTLAQGVSAAPVGGHVWIKGNSLSHEHPTLTKALTLHAVGGIATIGQ